MNKIYEEEFMELQSEFISLCLEVAEQKVDTVYAYCSMEEKSKMFNAFFRINGEIKTLNQLGVNSDLVMQFLGLGTEDLEKIKELCSKYNTPTPTEIKMYYDATTGKYNAEYKYDAVCTSKTGLSSGSVFMEWITETKNSLN